MSVTYFAVRHAQMPLDYFSATISLMTGMAVFRFWVRVVEFFLVGCRKNLTLTQDLRLRSAKPFTTKDTQDEGERESSDIHVDHCTSTLIH